MCKMGALDALDLGLGQHLGQLEHARHVLTDACELDPGQAVQNERQRVSAGWVESAIGR